MLIVTRVQSEPSKVRILAAPDFFFSFPRVHTGSETPTQWAPKFFLGCKVARAWGWPPHLVGRLRMNGDLSPPPLHAFIAYAGTSAAVPVHDLDACQEVKISLYAFLTSAPDNGYKLASRCDRCYPNERRPTTIALVAGCTRNAGHKALGGNNLMYLQDLEPRFADRLTDTAIM